MKYKAFEHHFSWPRINRYLIATNNSRERTLRLYKQNLRIAQSFHPLLGILEVALRNSLNDIMSNYFQDNNWIINQKNGFMSDPSLTYVHKKTGRRITNEFLKHQVIKAEKRLRNAGITVSSGRIIADQSLGFWTEFFELYYYKILKGTPIKVFRSLPSGIGRKEVNEELEKIRKFRNRINHNEPVCFKGQVIDFAPAMEVYNSIINILTWINPEFLKYIRDIDGVNKVITAARNI